jgi:hypothetical protein
MHLSSVLCYCLQKLSCRVLKQSEVHPQLFKGANRKFKKVRCNCPRQYTWHCRCCRRHQGSVCNALGMFVQCHVVVAAALREECVCSARWMPSKMVTGPTCNYFLSLSYAAAAVHK